MDLLGPLNNFTGGIALIVVGVIFYAVIKVSMKGRPIKEVLFLRPRDRRGEAMTVTKETDRSLVCGKTDPIHRFIKVGPGYVFAEAGKAITRFWGIEGTAYTADLNTGKNEGSIPEFLKSVWSKKFYDKLPEERKKAIETDKIGVIVDPIPIKEEEYGFPTLTSDDINDEGDAVVLDRISRGIDKGNTKREFYQLLTGVIMGMGIMAMLTQLGWF